MRRLGSATLRVVRGEARSTTADATNPFPGRRAGAATWHLLRLTAIRPSTEEQIGLVGNDWPPRSDLSVAPGLVCALGQSDRSPADATSPGTVDLMSDEYQTSMSVPLDSDGFLRRECPTCEREFKVFVHQDEGDGVDAQRPPPGDYYCPYCAIQANPTAWFTKAQIEAAKSKLVDEFVGPMLDDFKRSVETSPVVSVNVDKVEEPVAALTESDDMRRVDFACHPDTPVKVGDGYVGPVHCMICGHRA
jgi:hypothetical protein